jgi:hypothetical protein
MAVWRPWGQRSLILAQVAQVLQVNDLMAVGHGFPGRCYRPTSRRPGSWDLGASHRRSGR